MIFLFIIVKEEILVLQSSTSPGMIKIIHIWVLSCSKLVFFKSKEKKNTKSEWGLDKRFFFF